MALRNDPGQKAQSQGVVRALLRPRAGLRWSLSQRITAAIPPGDERYFPLAMYVAQNFQPITKEEEKHLIASAPEATPIFRHLQKT